MFEEHFHETQATLPGQGKGSEEEEDGEEKTTEES